MNIERRAFRLMFSCPCGRENRPQQVFIMETKELMVRCFCHSCRAVYLSNFKLAELIAECPKSEGKPLQPPLKEKITVTEEDRNFLTAMRITF